MNINTDMQNKGFTLTETLITIIILGIVAAILVPNLINRQVENANRTKVKKAMAAYEKAINFMIIENDIRTTEGLREFTQEDDCESAKQYFKTVQDGANDCIFKTADRVWWDITDLTNPTIILKDSQLNKNTTELQTLAKDVNDKTVFSMVGRFDDLGTLRVNDNAYEQSQMNNMNNKEYMVKLWGFTTNTKIALLSELASCSLNKVTTCTVTINGTSVTYSKVTSNSDTIVDALYNGNPITCIYNKDSNPQRTCSGYTSIAPAGEYWISQDLGKINAADAKSVCASSVYGDCTKYGDYHYASKLKCEALGGRLPNMAELLLATQNGKIRSQNNIRYWASEEGASNNGYFMELGTIRSYGKGNSYNRVVCIGVE